MTRRLFLILSPLVALVVAAFALYQGYAAFVVVRAGSPAFGALYGVLAVAGLAIATTILRLRQRIRALPR